MLQRRMPGRLMGSVPLWGGGLGAFKFDPALVTFTPGMAKRTSPGPFATAPIVQGNFADSAEVGDIVNLGRGSQIVADYFYETQDTYQGSISFWITPEWDGTEEESRYIFGQWGAGVYLETHGGVGWRELKLGHGASGINLVSTTIFGWTAGTTYHVVCRWDIKNTLDGTNHACISINGVHTFGRSSTWVNSAPPANVSFGVSWNDTLGINAIIEGFTVYRRPLFDGQYGIAANWDDSGPVDEIEEIYAAGAGADPCLITGSWDVVFCLPTNSTAEELTTGTGEAWSHPHSSGVLEHQWLEDGGYLGDAWAVKGNGSDTNINCGSGATLDDVPAAAQMTIEFWAKIDSDVASWATMVSKVLGTTGGWRIQISASGNISFNVYTDGTNAGMSSQSADLLDGKWHHYAITYNDAVGRIPVLWMDGKLVPVWTTAATGTYGTEAAQDFQIFNGTTTDLIGWVRYSDNIRYAAEFVPPRVMPGADGNTVEQWAMNEGTGATAAATVTSPANDGTITNGTWEEQWDQETTPIVPYSVEFDGAATVINCGSDASIDDIQSGILYAEAWVRIGTEDANKRVMVKGNSTTAGWMFNINSGTIQATIYCATTDATSQALHATVGMKKDDKLYHILMAYNNGGDRKIYFAVNGIWASAYDEQIAGNGAIVTDAALNLYLGFTDANTFEGAMGYARLSDVARWAVGSHFTPPSRLNPPGVDGNTLAQYNFRDGPGTVLLDETANNNDGTITFGDGQWRITPDMEIDSPGERVFNWGYVIGNDAVDEGLTQILSGLDAGENYVVRTVASIESASRGRPKIIIYDETNGAEITSLEGPSFTGVHDGLANAATLTDTTARFPQMLVGWTIYNITDGSSATITAISGDMQIITGALSGGTDDDWDISDEYRIVPPGGPSYYDDYPWIETFTFELPTIARNGAAADCVSISVKLVNGVNEGVIKWHQIELLENLLDNPSMETGAGNPWIPDGWVNNGLDAGDTVQELAEIHSGSGSIEFAAGAVDGEYLDNGLETVVAGEFICFGGWTRGDGSSRIDIMGSSGLEFQYTAATGTSRIVGDNDDSWRNLIAVGRAEDISIRLNLAPSDGGASSRYADDVYLFVLDDVSLTVTPASEVNSAESGGLRVDGLDGCTQPIPAGILGATLGWIKWKVLPRHGNGDLRKFQSTNVDVVRFWFGGADNILVYATSDTNIRVAIEIGGVTTTGNWTPTNLVANTEQLWEIKYTATQCILIIDGVIQITIVPGAGIDFGANIPNIAYWGSNNGLTQQIDAVFKAP